MEVLSHGRFHNHDSRYYAAVCPDCGCRFSFPGREITVLPCETFFPNCPECHAEIYASDVYELYPNPFNKEKDECR